MPVQNRLVSIDFFRGLTIAGMILVNNPGSWAHVYAPLLHAEWNGCTMADLVFPFFLFLVGVSITLALKKAKQNKENHNKIIVKILKRTVLLFVFGLFLNAVPTFDLETLRIPGVLQRIAIVFLVAALLYLKTSRNIIYIVTTILLVGYWLLIAFVPAPGIEAGSMVPGNNLAAWVDVSLLDGHLWQYSKTWDPEGILSTIPAIGSGLIGVLIGDWFFQSTKSEGQKTLQLVYIGLVLVAVGLGWSTFFPINKSLWTSSFSLFTAGIAALFMALSYWLIDIKGYKKITKPFVVFGANAITAYMGSELLSRIISYVNWGDLTIKGQLFDSVLSILSNPYATSLLLAISMVGLFLIPLWYMYNKKIFLKV